MNSVPLNNKYAPNIRPNSSEVESQKRPCQVQNPLFHRIMDNTFVLEREGTAAKISQVAEGVLILLILCTVIGGLIFIGTCYAIDYFSTPSRLHEAIDYEYGERRGQVPFSLESSVNKNTLIPLSGQKWNESRIIDGKLARYKKIGAESIILNTKSGDRIHGCYFDANKFEQQLREQYEVDFVKLSLTHPFLQGDPVLLRSTSDLLDSDCSIEGVRISTKAGLDLEFRIFCEEMGYRLIQESEIDPDGERYILVKEASVADKALSGFEVTESQSFDSNFSLFNPKFQTENVLLFRPSSKPFDVNWLVNRQQIISFQDQWIVRDCSRQDFLDTGPGTFIDKIQDLKRDYSFLQAKRSERNEKREQLKQGVITLSNAGRQSMYSYHQPKEIFHLLSSGMNLLIYDHPGVGLSQGSPTRVGMIETMRSCGNFLKEVKGFKENQLLFRGQCSGGFAVAHAAQLFPQSHIWIDQAPRKLNDQDLIINLFNSFLPSKILSLILSALPIVIWKLFFAPTYDILDRLRGEGKGLQIYTIGVPDEQGSGGDQLVPKSHQEEFKDLLGSQERGHYLTLQGGEHVRPIALFPAVSRKIQQLFVERLSSE